MYLWMKKKALVAVLLAFALLVSLFGCSNDAPEASVAEATPTRSVSGGSSTDTWAIYWYLCGSDLESENGFASIDLEEMMQVDLPENVTVIIETGGANEWLADISANHNSRFLYNSEGLTLLEENPVANMGDPDTLEDFLLFCNENYPADKQGVVFWNHGGGSVSGAAFDELFDDDSLTLPEMRTAFENAGTASGEKYELIGFDTCLMATIDVVDVFGNFGNYLVASEENEPGGGWDYEALFEALSDDPSMDGAQLGREICDSYYAACKKDGTGDMITLSVVDLAWAQELVEAYNGMGTDALAGAGVYSSYHSDFGRAARSAENYGGNNSTDGYSNMVDIGDLVLKAGDELLPFSGESMLSVLDSAVVYQVKGPLRSNASGLSCYYNYNGDYDNYSGFSDLETSPAFYYYYDYMLTGEVSDDLVEYMRTASTTTNTTEEFAPPPMVMPEKSDLEDFPVEISDDGIATMTLGADTAEKLVGVYATLGYVDYETGTAILLGFDNDLEADWANGIFSDNFRGVWGSLDGELVYMELSDEADDYQVYAVPVMLDEKEYTMVVSYIYATEEYKILGLRSGIDDNGMADRNIRPLMDGDVVTPLHYVIDVESGEVTQVGVSEVVITADSSFYETDMGDGEFVFMFEMRDIQNNSYLSQVVAITVEDGEIYLSEV